MFFLISIIVAADFIVNVAVGTYAMVSIYTFFENLFLRLISQYYILRTTKEYWKKHTNLLDESVIQIVEVTLMPKATIKK